MLKKHSGNISKLFLEYIFNNWVIFKHVITWYFGNEALLKCANVFVCKFRHECLYYKARGSPGYIQTYGVLFQHINMFHLSLQFSLRWPP